ncbi:MAG: adenosylcobinamide-GDP ribazoletransferase [Xanthobacteraceae bacterium]
MTISDSWLENRAEELKASIVFCTRLPLLPATPLTGNSLSRAAWAFPVAGILVGLVGAIVYGIAHRLGLPPWPAAALGVAATMLATGCLHEDGIADTADGFGGGHTREQKLAIMRDSHIGAYGVCALAMSLLLRVGALASLPSGHAVVWALIASHAAARATMPALMLLLPPARSDGLSFDAGRPAGESVAAAAVIGFLVLAICLHVGHGFLALLVLAVIAALVAWLAKRQIGGQTGDVLGALEQVSEIAVLLVALA